MNTTHVKSKITLDDCDEATLEALRKVWGRRVGMRELEILSALNLLECQEQQGQKTIVLSNAIADLKQSIYVGEKVAPYSCDAELASFLCECFLAALDPFFGREGKRLKLRLLLTLLHLESAGQAVHEIRDGQFVFRATNQLPVPSGPSETRAVLAEMSHEGTLCMLFSDEGQELWAITPKGYFCDQPDCEIDHVQRKIFMELAQKFLMRLEGERWNPTPEGRNRGLAEEKFPAVWLVEELGFLKEVEEADFGKNSLAPVAIIA